MKLIQHYSRLVRGLGGLLLGTLALGGCAEFHVPGAYRIDIQQGNIITQEQLAALESGMEKRKVRFILGTPLVTDAFNQQRWDYYYSLEKAGEERVQRIISVFFEGDLLKHVGGDVLAATGPIEVPKRIDKVVTVPDGYRDEGLLASITPGFLSGKPKRQPTDDNSANKPQGLSDDAKPQTSDAAAPQADPKDAVLPAGASAPPAAALEAPTTLDKPRTEIDAEDERYLRNLLGDFGRDLASKDTAASAPESAATGDLQDEQEGLLSRWAKRFGVDQLNPFATPPATDNSSASPAAQ